MKCKRNSSETLCQPGDLKCNPAGQDCGSFNAVRNLGLSYLQRQFPTDGQMKLLRDRKTARVRRFAL